MLAEACGMVEAAYGGDARTMFFKRLKRFGELVVWTRLLDLVFLGVHPVGQINEYAASRLEHCAGGGMNAGRSHRIKEREGECDAGSLEEVTTAEEPRLGKIVHGNVMGVLVD
jgi:hypothetical protein